MKCHSIGVEIGVAKECQKIIEKTQRHTGSIGILDKQGRDKSIRRSVERYGRMDFIDIEDTRPYVFEEV